MPGAPRENNFDLLRLLFAGGVFLWHAYELARVPLLAPLAGILVQAADWGVKGFFVISGYLVVMSYGKSAGWRDYAGKRVRRIYPAYATVVLASAALGAFFSSLPPGEYFSTGVLRYLAANLAFLNFLAPTLPGVFAGQPFAEVNGALWTLKIEVMFYALVPLLAWLFARAGHARTLAVLYVLSVAYGVAMGALHERSGGGAWLQLQRQLPGQLTYFLVGAAMYLYRDALAPRLGMLAVCGAGLLLLAAAVGSPAATALCEPLGLGALVVYAATGVRHLGNAARYGDLSYGLYIIHFPVLQAAVALGWFAAAPGAALAGCVLLILLLSAASWHLVERRFLSRASWYRMAEAGPRPAAQR